MGTLYLVSTPIGNLEDITIRAIKTLFTVDTILCEDTRRTGNFLHELKTRFPEYCAKESTPEYTSYYDEIEEKRLPEIIYWLQEGKNLALVSDNGTPTISDPGFRLVRECVKRNIPVTAVPGANAAIAGLSLSGLPTNHFTFLGFLPEKQTARLKLLTEVQQTETIVSSTFITYCAPHKLEQTLTDLSSVFGDREVVITRELTKIHEEILRGKISSLLPRVGEIKGEIVLLF